MIFFNAAEIDNLISDETQTLMISLSLMNFIEIACLKSEVFPISSTRTYVTAFSAFH